MKLRGEISLSKLSKTLPKMSKFRKINRNRFAFPEHRKNVFKVLSRDSESSCCLRPITQAQPEITKTLRCAIDFHFHWCRQKGSCTEAIQFKIDCFQLSAAVVNEKAENGKMNEGKFNENKPTRTKRADQIFTENQLRARRIFCCNQQLFSPPQQLKHSWHVLALINKRNV